MEKKAEKTPPAKKRFIKSFFRQYFEELNDWDKDVLAGWFLFFPLVAGVIVAVIEMIRTYVFTAASIPFFSTVFLCLLKGIFFMLGLVAMVVIGVAVYILIGMAIIRFLEWVKSE